MAFLKNQKPTSIFILADTHTEVHCLPKLRKKSKQLAGANVILIPPGENHKTLKMVQYIWHHLMDRHADRHALLINLGGGVICDMGGWAASSYKRGIPFIHVPTSLLAMTDAAIGGKVGINYANFKNMIGTFQNPEGIFIYTEFLKSLPEPHLISGMAEIIKHGLLEGGGLWNLISGTPRLNQIDWERLVTDSAKIKMDIVQDDFVESGSRKVLNLGHTFGHALEGFSLKTEQPLLHGEAVAIGLIMEAFISYQKKMLTKKDLKQIEKTVLHYFPKQSLKEYPFHAINDIMHQDKKNKSGKISFTLLTGIGKPKYNKACSPVLLESAYNYYQSL